MEVRKSPLPVFFPLPFGPRPAIYGLLLISLFFSCQREKVYISAFILRSVGAPWLYPSYYKEVYVHNKTGFSTIPTSLINDTALSITDYHYNWYLFSDFNSLNIDQNYHLRVLHPNGEAIGKVYLPGEYEILQPESTYILNRDSVLKIFWRKANGAKFYWLDLSIEYDYDDTLGEWDDYEFWLDTIIFDTFCIFEKNRFIPFYVDTIYEGEGVIDIWAMDGPPILPGSFGNIIGSGYGFFHTAYQPGLRYFFVGAPPKERSLKPKGKLNRLRLFQNH